MFKSVVITAGVLAMGTPAAAQTPPPSSGPAQSAPKAKDPNRITCERVEQIGSRLSAKKICHTAAEWEELRKTGRDQVEDWQRQLTSPGKPAG